MPTQTPQQIIDNNRFRTLQKYPDSSFGVPRKIKDVTSEGVPVYDDDSPTPQDTFRRSSGRAHRP